MMRDAGTVLPAILFACVLAIGGGTAGGQDEKSGSLDACLARNGFDEAAAKKFGADKNGMKKYVIAFLRRGPNRPTDPEKAKELQAAHMKNINRMAAEGKLVLAGPFMEDGDLRGIYIFNAATLAEAEALTNTDPAVKAGSLVMELKEWYGSAALMAVNAIHERLTSPEQAR
jgi:uncharacterized protein YciI